MTLQSTVALSLIAVSALMSVPALVQRFSAAWGLLIAHTLVVLGGVLALWFAEEWAGWLTAALFALLIACPIILGGKAELATQRGQLRWAARLQQWAAFLHPSPLMRFGLALSRARTAHGPNAEEAALMEVEATGSRTQKALARLLLAEERRDWERLLVLSRSADLNDTEAKPRELRALGELGRLDEMVLTYKGAGRSISPWRPGCMLYVFAYTGREEGVQQLLAGPLSRIEDDSKNYWLAVAKLRKDHNDETAHSMLKTLSEAGLRDRLRRGAAQLVELVSQNAYVPPSLGEENARTVDALVKGPVDRAPLVKGPLDRTLSWEEFWQQYKRRMRARLIPTACFLVIGLMLIVISIAMQVHTFRHIPRPR